MSYLKVTATTKLVHKYKNSPKKKSEMIKIQHAA